MDHHDKRRLFDCVDDQLPRAVDRLKEFLRFPSVSTSRHFAQESRRCAAWLADQLRELGFVAEVRETGGQPAVVARDSIPPTGTPHVLYYGHYDVVPADPIDLWTSPPFQPAVVSGPHGDRVVARGAVDDKGQIMTWLGALRAWRMLHGALPVNVTILVEGEEEIGSPSLERFLAANAAELKADACIISDTLMMAIDRPALTARMRGQVYVEIAVHGPGRDLHSGTFGGAVRNPAATLAKLIAGLHDDHGRIQIPGFYDDIQPVPAALRAEWDKIEFDEDAFLSQAGVTASHGEHGWSIRERVWARPCCDVNGIWGGYIEPGHKTVIPAKAFAKISCRLVAGQNPDKVASALGSFFASRVPSDCRLEFKVLAAAPPVTVDVQSPFVAAARLALTDAFGREPVLRGGAGSLPSAGIIKQALGCDSVLMGFGLADDRTHSPDEKFEIACLRQGMRSHAALLARLKG